MFRRRTFTFTALCVTIGMSAQTESRQLLKTVYYYSEGDKDIADYRYKDNRLWRVIDNPDNEEGIITFEYDKLDSEGIVEVWAGGPMWRQYHATLQIGENGLVKRADYDYYYIFQKGELTFSYDDSGHLIGVENLHDEEADTFTSYTLSYTDGNLTGVRSVEKMYGVEEEGYTLQLEYNGVENKGRLMYYEIMGGIELGVLEYAYYAGLIGSCSAELPTALILKDEDGIQRANLSWTLDADGYPQKMTAEDGEYMTFEWSGGTGVPTMIPDGERAMEIYGADGGKRQSMQRGINIIRHADGSTSKVMR